MARVGRPSEGASAKRAPLNLKTSPEMRERIERSAEASGLSLTQEVERRLADSYKEEDWLGGPATAAFLKRAAADISAIERLGGHTWEDEYTVWYAASQAIQQAFRDYGPAPPNAPQIIAAGEARNQRLAELTAAARQVGSADSEELVAAALALNEAEIVFEAAWAAHTDALEQGSSLYRRFGNNRALAAALDALAKR